MPSGEVGAERLRGHHHFESRDLTTQTSEEVTVQGLPLVLAVGVSSPAQQETELLGVRNDSILSGLKHSMILLEPFTAWMVVAGILSHSATSWSPHWPELCRKPQDFMEKSLS